LTNTPPSERTRLHRRPKRGSYDKKTIHAILDAGMICHLGISIEGQPFVTPMIHWREGDRIYFHGSSKSRTLTHMATGAPVCVSLSLLDGIVLARSGFNHSVNFRSIMLFGTAHLIEDGETKEKHLQSFMDRLFPGRWQELRPVTPEELKATSVMWMEIDEASAKLRAGGPNDDEDDYSLPVWAGVLPISTVIGKPEPCSRLPEGINEPEYLGALKIE